MSRSTQSTTERGQRAEQRAVEELERRGYQVVERNFRCPVGEIDIVARDGATLVFVEVRSRADDERGDALESVTPAKQRQVARAARAYLAARQPQFDDCRFDVVGITGERIAVVIDAFRIGV